MPAGFFYDPNEMGPSLMGGWPWLSCYQGDLALDAERLPRSYYRKVIWGMDDGIYAFTTPPAYTGKPLYGTGWHWHNVLPSWTYGEEYVGKPIQVEAYCDCDEVEFFVNGESQGKAAPVEMIATLTVTYQPGQLKAVAYRQGKPVGESVLETTGSAVALRLEADRQSLSADHLGFVLRHRHLGGRAGPPRLQRRQGTLRVPPGPGHLGRVRLQ